MFFLRGGSQNNHASKGGVSCVERGRVAKRPHELLEKSVPPPAHFKWYPPNLNYVAPTHFQTANVRGMVAYIGMYTLLLH